MYILDRRVAPTTNTTKEDVLMGTAKIDERELFTTKWFEYRCLEPEAATEVFRHEREPAE